MRLKKPLLEIEFEAQNLGPYAIQLRLETKLFGLKKTFKENFDLCIFELNTKKSKDMIKQWGYLLPNSSAQLKYVWIHFTFKFTQCFKSGWIFKNLKLQDNT